MNRRVVSGILITLLVVGALAAVGLYAYSWGVAQGAMQNTQIVVPEGGAVTAPVYPWAGGPFYHYGPGYGRWGMGFGPLGCLFPLLGFLLFFALLRGLFWGWGRRGWGGHHRGGWGNGGNPPPMFEEWHRRAHGETPPAEAPKNE